MIMKIEIEIKDSLAGYQFKDDNDNVVQFENLSILERIRILNSFANGYELFIDALNEE